MRGTPYFMAPEVLSQDKLGDVATSGAAAASYYKWRHTRSRKLLEFKTPMALFYHVASTNDPPPIDSYDLSPALKALILRCFERDPRKRAHAFEVLDDPFFCVEEDSQEVSGDACENTVDRITRGGGRGAAGRPQHGASGPSRPPSFADCRT